MSRRASSAEVALKSVGAGFEGVVVTDLRMPGDATADTTTNSTTNNETSDETSDETSNETSGDVTQAPIEVVDEVDLTLEDGTNEDNAIDLTI